MSETTREAVYTLRVEQGPALANFEALTKRIVEARVARTQLTKALKDSQQVEKDLLNAVGLSGKAEDERQAALKRVRADIERQTKALSDATLQEKFLSAQSRELGNDLAKLTEMGLRFRDKMADATLQALRQSGALEQMSVRTEVLQRDIASVNASLEKNQQTLTELEAAYRKGEKTEQQYREEQAKLNEENKKLATSNEKLQGELTGVTDRLNKAEKEVEELNAAFKAGKISQEEFRRGLQSIDESAKSLGAKFDTFVKGQGAELKSTLSSLALQYVGVGAAIYGVQRVLGSAIDIVKDFDSALGNVKALGGEFESRIEELGNAARTIGPKFGVGAAEAVGAIEALAKAGVSADDILRGGLEGALTLSASGMDDVGAAAELASGTMTQFGLSGKDVTHIADLLAAGANQAQGEVGDFGMALKQSGLVASQAGLSLEETIGTLGAFASNALLGSDAGTSFRTMLLRLANPSKEAASTMEALGIHAHDTNGEFVGMANLAGQLQQQLGGLTDEQRNAALATIFGNDAVRAANVLYQQGAEGITDWIGKVDQSGFAAQVAADKLDTLKGSMAQASAAWTAFVTGIDNGTGIIARAVRGVVELTTSVLELMTTSQAELAGEKFGQAVQSGIAKSFGQFQTTLDETNMEAAFQNEAARVAASVSGTIQQLSFDIGVYAEEARKLTETGRQLTGDEKFRLGVIREAQAQLVAELDKRIEAEEKLGKVVLDGNELAGQQIADTKEYANTLAGLNEELKALNEKKNTTNLADQAAVDGLDAQIQAINQRIKAIQDETKALSDKEIQARETKREMDALNATGPQAVAPIPLSGGGQVDANGQPVNDLAGDVSPGAKLEIDTTNSIAQAISDRLVLYDQERAAYDELQQAKTAAVGGFASALGTLAKEGSLAAKSMFVLQKAVAIADVITKTQAGIAAAQAASASVPPFIGTIPNPAYAVAKAIEIATIAKLKVTQAVSIATIAAQTIAGFAEGGDVSGDVKPSWGPRISRGNGDNVLVRAGRGMVTLKTGEKVLNEDQQREAERRYGRSIWGDIGIPGYAAGGGIKPARGTALVNFRAREEELLIAQLLRMGMSGNLGGADILATDLATPRPSPSTIAGAELSTALKAFAERPIYVAVDEINRMQHRVEVIDSASGA